MQKANSSTLSFLQVPIFLWMADPVAFCITFAYIYECCLYSAYIWTLQLVRHLFVTLTLLGDKISHKTSRSSASCHLGNLSCTMFPETWVLECCMNTSFATLHFDRLWFSVVACICLLHRIFLHERWRLHVFVGITPIFSCCCGNYDNLVDINFSSMVKTHYHYHWVVI